MGVIATPTSSVVNFLGTRTDPQEVKQLRKSSMDFHLTMGQIVVHKHRWNEKDVAEGRAHRCPFHSDAYGGRDAYDDYCFGTGYLGGFSDGVLVPVTLGDTQEDVFRPNDQGVLIHERHPGMTAPWIPEMGDDDMLIVVEVDPITNDIIEMGDRYELREVTPVTMRGPHFKTTRHMKPFRVSQEAMVDLLPYGHQFYNVPVNFNYNNVPSPLPPDYPPLPSGASYGIYEASVRLIGEEPQDNLLSVEYDVRVNSYPSASVEVGVKVTGAPGGTHFNW